MAEVEEEIRTGPQETRKRKREIFAIFFIGLLFTFLTWFEIQLITTSESLPFIHSIFFFGLVNFNIVLFLLMLFLIFRNVVKIFVERRGRVIGSSLKAKLVASFVAFSFIPTMLMLIISVFYINSSFEKWFSLKISNVLKSSLEITNAYYFDAKKENYHFANLISQELSESSPGQVGAIVQRFRNEYSLDAVEFYTSILGDRALSVGPRLAGDEVPRVSVELLQKGLRDRLESSTIHQYGNGNLVRVVVPLKPGHKGAVVVTSFIPVSLVSKMDDISEAYAEFRNLDPIEYPVKSIYLILLILMTLVILLCATWFGFYLAKQLSIPLVMLGKATKRVSRGEYEAVDVESGSEEISQLVNNFNSMTAVLALSEREIKAKSESLRKTLNQLDEHSRYIEVVLTNVSTGVISVDQNGVITTINEHAGKLLKLKPQEYIGRSVREILNREYYKTFSDLLRTMSRHKVESISREIRAKIEGDSIPLQMNLSILKDETGREIGKILVFDDMSMIIDAQRAAAWTEVARRIAHEIKNPLTPIKLSAQRLQRKFGDEIHDQAFEDCTRMIIQQVDDLKTLVNEFSQFARLPQAKRVFGHINKVIDEGLVLYRSAHRESQFEFQADESVPEFKFDPDQIKRVIQNLVENGLAAVPEGVTPHIVVKTSYDDQLELLRMSIEDNGIGIPEHQRVRIFEPYFSTKDSGTGLGLAIVKRIVEDHNGFIRAFAAENGGTRMVIEIPVVVTKNLTASAD